MERSLADELYSEVSQPKSELGHVSVPDNKQNNSHDELWFEDESSWNDTVEELDHVSDLDREWQRRRNEFHTVGYRDGLMAGKEASAQDGFNVGFDESVFAGFKWGLVRGVTSALPCLPDGLKERMVEKDGNRNKFCQLYESVNSISTTDALKLFHGNLPNKTEKKIDTAKHSSDGSLFDHYYGELQSLISESPAVKVQFGNNQKSL